MSQNGLIAATLANGTDMRHAVPDVALQGLLTRNRTYTRPVCGARGRDSTGYTTVVLTMVDSKPVPFSLDEYHACARCLRIAKKMSEGETLEQARHVRAPEITPSVRKIMDADISEMTVSPILDSTVRNNLTDEQERRVRLVLTDAPWRVKEERVLDYREPVFLPSRLEKVTFVERVMADGRVLRDVTGHRRYFHPKSLRPVVGTKLPHSDLVSETDEDVIAALKSYGITI